MIWQYSHRKVVLKTDPRNMPNFSTSKSLNPLSHSKLMKINRNYIYTLSFLEGGAVMACELISAKMLAPYFGTSLYVWASALGLTLGGLMTGYFLGGLLSHRKKNNALYLYWILIFAGLALFIMPYTSGWVMEATLGLPIQLGAVLSLFAFMFPPLVFMGMVSPLIINILTEQAKEAGNRAGNVYAISTLGGIIATFLMGFWIIPEFGISAPAMIAGLMLAALPALSLLRLKKSAAPLLWLLMLASLLSLQFMDSNGQDQWHIHYHSEGVLGQIKVLDFAPNEHAPQHIFRGLVINNTLQTVLDLSDPNKDYWQYTKLLTGLVEQQYPPNSKVLVLGMGGGTLVKRLLDQGYQVDAVEIDSRLKTVASQFFKLPAQTTVYLDDARHFIKTTGNIYDVVIYDVFRGESAPEHVLTLESLNETKDNLKADGLLLINFYGYWTGSRGAIGRSVFKTLLQAGFQTELLATSGTEDERNLVFVSKMNQQTPLPGKQENYFSAQSIEVLPSDTAQALILTDSHPQLQLYGRASAQWRNLYNDFYTRQFSKYKFY